MAVWQFIFLVTTYLYCTYGQGDLPCVVGNETIPDYVCERGYWPDANALINGDWIVSRSTHYGSTAGGACGYDNVPNCYNPGASCGSVPNDIQTSAYAGMYAAPQGDYFTQLGDYLSCGECFEIKCVDPTCTYNEPITINLADSCPCKPNQKWCCAQYSYCVELRGDSINGSPHCAISENGTWTNNSLHLDLNDVAYSMVATGKKGQVPNSGSINTLMRRVSCTTNGNTYIMIDGSSMYTDQCYTIYPDPPLPCFRYLALNVYNVRGYGGVQNVTLYAGLIENNTLVYKEFEIYHNQDFPLDDDQEQYGDWVAPNVGIYFPLQFIITDRGGRNISSAKIANFSGGVPAFYDMMAQFDPINLFKR